MRIMRIMKTETHTREHTFCDKILCDLCGKQGIGDSWESGYYECNETEVEVTIHQKDGHTYQGGGDGYQYTVDLCPDCFKDRLIPWLNSQGANLKPVEWDY